MNRVEHLKKGLQEKMDDRERRNNLSQREKDVFNMIKNTPEYQLTDFWCSICSKDITTEGRKQVRRPMGIDPLPYAYFEATCKEGHKVIRYITDKTFDPYYRNSEVQTAMRNEAELDMLTPDDPRFRKLYGDPKEKLRNLVK